MSESSGFLLINKSPGITSFDVIRSLRKITGIRRIGHTGTLDPFATGLLVCALGSYTRLCQYLETLDKSYAATLKLGERTTTGDTEGEIIQRLDAVPNHIDEEILTAKVMNLHELPTPAYSAVKIQGKPAYAYAREGNIQVLPPRPVKVKHFASEDYTPPCLKYNCTVSKGTYIRSMSEYIAECLGTVGYTSALCRTGVGSLKLSEAVDIQVLHSDDFSTYYYPEDLIFAGFERLTPDESMLTALRNGQGYASQGNDFLPVMLFNDQGRIIGVAKRRDNYLEPVVNLLS